MATTHVFIVDTNTFKYHLEYLFAGTGAKDSFMDFNNNPTTKLYHTTENNLLSMIGDAQRVRKDDYVIFYLQQNFSDNVSEGKFYGIFKIKHNNSFLDNNDDDQFLKQELNKSLTFRVLIEPFEIYSKGVTEWEALDEIKHIQSPNQMLWSLIYRKLKGNRGNTMITIYEADRLFQLIRNENDYKKLIGPGFTFNKDTQTIESRNQRLDYKGRMETINIFPRLLKKYQEGKSFEPHLQTYIVQHIGQKINAPLDESIIPTNSYIEWIGKEVSCGVGMQRIDILLSFQVNEHHRIVAPIELKAMQANATITRQMQRYIDWIEQYYLPNRPSAVQPIIIAQKVTNKQSNEYRQFISAMKTFNYKNEQLLPIKYIEFEITNSDIDFSTIEY